jgi:hypothetical protein
MIKVSFNNVYKLYYFKIKVLIKNIFKVINVFCIKYSFFLINYIIFNNLINIIKIFFFFNNNNIFFLIAYFILIFFIKVNKYNNISYK